MTSNKLSFFRRTASRYKHNQAFETDLQTAIAFFEAYPTIDKVSRKYPLPIECLDNPRFRNWTPVHSFRKLGGKIYILAKGILSQGTFGDIKLMQGVSKDIEGKLFVLKKEWIVEKTCELEPVFAQDVGLGVTDRIISNSLSPSSRKKQKSHILEKGVNLSKRDPVIPGQKYLHVQHYAGISLRQYLENQTIVPYATRLKIAISLCSLVDKLHSGQLSKSEQKIFHGDIKPENILIQFEQDKIILTLIDYGFSEILDDNPLTFKGTLPYLLTSSYNHPQIRSINVSNLAKLGKETVDTIALARSLCMPKCVRDLFTEPLAIAFNIFQPYEVPMESNLGTFLTITAPQDGKLPHQHFKAIYLAVGVILDQYQLRITFKRGKIWTVPNNTHFHQEVLRIHDSPENPTNAPFLEPVLKQLAQGNKSYQLKALCKKYNCSLVPQFHCPLLQSFFDKLEKRFHSLAPEQQQSDKELQSLLNLFKTRQDILKLKDTIQSELIELENDCIHLLSDVNQQQIQRYPNFLAFIDRDFSDPHMEGLPSQTDQDEYLRDLSDRLNNILRIHQSVRESESYFKKINQQFPDTLVRIMLQEAYSSITLENLSDLLNQPEIRQFYVKLIPYLQQKIVRRLNSIQPNSLDNLIQEKKQTLYQQSQLVDWSKHSMHELEAFAFQLNDIFEALDGLNRQINVSERALGYVKIFCRQLCPELQDNALQALTHAFYQLPFDARPYVEYTKSGSYLPVSMINGIHTHPACANMLTLYCRFSFENKKLTTLALLQQLSLIESYSEKESTQISQLRKKLSLQIERYKQTSSLEKIDAILMEMDKIYEALKEIQNESNACSTIPTISHKSG